jgi:ArsR family transcriptional regulator
MRECARKRIVGDREHDAELASLRPPLLTPDRQFDNYLTMPDRTRRASLSADQFVMIAKALADPRRVALLEAIARNDEECPCQRLCRDFPVSKATISHHIRELVRAGLVDARREGQYLNCQVRRDMLEAYTQELLRRVGAQGTA